MAQPLETEAADIFLKEGEEKKEETPEDAVFDELLVAVGEYGPFQKRFNFIFNFVFIILISMPYLNFMLAMAVPDHWCHVPGRDDSNYTLDEWKNMTLPRNVDGSYSQCEMYNFSTESNTTDPSSTVECQFGWNYDRTWYEETAATQENWVCDRALYISNTFAFNRLGDVIGTLVFGQLGDTLGRRPVFYITLVLQLLGRFMSIFTSNSFPVFLFAATLGSMSLSASFNSPLALGLEMAPDGKRAQIAMLQSVGWMIGISIVPLVAWANGHWVVFMIVTTLPSAIFLFLFSFPESPRWLASRGRTRECLVIMRSIAKVNGQTLPEEAEQQLRRLEKKKERTYGLASLFSSYRLAINTIVISFSWVVNALSYYTLFLNVSNMPGNPFINYLLQALIELPAYIVGKELSDRLGRRWSHAAAFVGLTSVYCALIAVVNDPSLETWNIVFSVVAKMCVTVTFYIVYLQSMETYPTCVRQTGNSFCALTASGFSVLGPYIVHLGTYDMRYAHGIMVILCALASVVVTVLPETLHQKLPETLHEAQKFGSDQPYWSFRPKKLARKKISRTE